jgi:hypothetical protein
MNGSLAASKVIAIHLLVVTFGQVQATPNDLRTPSTAQPTPNMANRAIKPASPTTKIKPLNLTALLLQTERGQTSPGTTTCQHSPHTSNSHALSSSSSFNTISQVPGSYASESSSLQKGSGHRTSYSKGFTTGFEKGKKGDR